MLTVKCSFLPHRKWNTIKLNAGGTNGIGPVYGLRRVAGVEIILQKRNNADICNPANWPIFPLLCVLYYHDRLYTISKEIPGSHKFICSNYRYIILRSQILTFSLQSQSDWADLKTVEVVACSACSVDMFWMIYVYQRCWQSLCVEPPEGIPDGWHL